MIARCPSCGTPLTPKHNETKQAFVRRRHCNKTCATRRRNYLKIMERKRSERLQPRLDAAFQCDFDRLALDELLRRRWVAAFAALGTVRAA